MKLVIIRTNRNNPSEYSEKDIQKIKRISPDLDITLIDPIKEIVDEILPQTNILLCSRYEIEKYLEIPKATKLQWIHCTSAGVNEFITLLKNSPILLTNSSGVSAIPIAEHVMGYLLMFSRQLSTSYKAQITSKEWIADPLILHCEELYHKTIGIIGFGRIGKRVAELAKAFGMTTITLRHETPISVTDIDTQYSPNELDQLLHESDFVICCLPLTVETKYMFTYERFKQMKKSAYFINISRGQIVKESDLVRAVQNQIIAGAGLDVFEEEPLPKTHPLWKLDTVIITPHIAGRTPYYSHRVIEVFCDNLVAFIEHKPMPNVVNTQKGY